jgi:hypothetical protein
MKKGTEESEEFEIAASGRAESAVEAAAKAGVESVSKLAGLSEAAEAEAVEAGAKAGRELGAKQGSLAGIREARRVAKREAMNKSKGKKEAVSSSKQAQTDNKIAKELQAGADKEQTDKASQTFGGNRRTGKVKMENGMKTLVGEKKTRKPRKMKQLAAEAVVNKIKNSSVGGSCGGGDSLKEMACVMYEQRALIAEAMGRTEGELAGLYRSIPDSLKNAFLRYRAEHNSSAFMAEYSYQYHFLVELLGAEKAAYFTKILGGVLEVTHRRLMSINIKRSGNNANIMRSDCLSKLVGGKIKRFNRRGRLMRSQECNKPNMRMVRKVVVKKSPGKIEKVKKVVHVRRLKMREPSEMNMEYEDWAKSGKK